MLIIESSESFEEYSVHTYQGKEYKYQDLHSFMEKFARSAKKESEQYARKKEDEKLKEEI